MKRTVSAHLLATAQPNTKLVYAIAPVKDPGYTSFEEELIATVDGEPIEMTEVADFHGGRFHVLETEKAVRSRWTTRPPSRARPTYR